MKIALSSPKKMIGNIVESSLNTQFFTVQQATADDSRVWNVSHHFCQVHHFFLWFKDPDTFRVSSVDYYSLSIRLSKLLLLKSGVQKVLFINHSHFSEFYSSCVLCYWKYRNDK